MTGSPPITAHLDPGAERERGEQHRHRQLRHLGRRAGDPRGVGLGAAMHDVMHHSNVLQCRGMEDISAGFKINVTHWNNQISKV